MLSIHQTLRLSALDLSSILLPLACHVKGTLHGNLRRGRLRRFDWLNFVGSSGAQGAGGCVGVDHDAGGHNFRIGEQEFSWRGAVGEETLALAEQDWIDE